MLSLEEDFILTSLMFERICDDADCPLIEIHKLSEIERVRWLRGLTGMEKKRILNHYRKHLRKFDSSSTTSS